MERQCVFLFENSAQVKHADGTRWTKDLISVDGERKETRWSLMKDVAIAITENWKRWENEEQDEGDEEEEGEGVHEEKKLWGVVL